MSFNRNTCHADIVHLHCNCACREIIVLINQKYLKLRNHSTQLQSLFFCDEHGNFIGNGSTKILPRLVSALVLRIYAAFMAETLHLGKLRREGMGIVTSNIPIFFLVVFQKN